MMMIINYQKSFYLSIYQIQIRTIKQEVIIILSNVRHIQSGFGEQSKFEVIQGNLFGGSSQVNQPQPGSNNIFNNPNSQHGANIFNNSSNQSSSASTGSVNLFGGQRNNANSSEGVNLFPSTGNIFSNGGSNNLFQNNGYSNRNKSQEEGLPIE